MYARLDRFHLTKRAGPGEAVHAFSRPAGSEVATTGRGHVNRDVTEATALINEHKQIEHALRESEQQLRWLVGGVACNIALLTSICSGTDHRLGATAGADIEYGITPAISAKFEYLYITAVSLEVSHLG
jgi:hypothetical protein